MITNITFLYKFFSYVKRKLFWRNKNIIYVNSNKKFQNKESIDAITKTNNYKWVICQSNTKLGYKFYKHHLLKMKKHLWDISRNSNELNEVTYAGFVSTMFAAYDGYVLGDNHKYIFVDTHSSNNKTYKVEYEKKFSSIMFEKKPSNKIVDVLFSCSAKINQLNDNLECYEFCKPSGPKVAKNYLQEVYSYAKNLFDLCNECGVERINLYICAKQPISFIIGTAIQSYHPTIYAYEYNNGKYDYCLNIQFGKLCD